MADAAAPPYQFAVISPDDRRGVLYITAFVTITYSTLTVLARCAIKWQVFGYDDWTTCAAWVQLSNSFVLVYDFTQEPP